MKFFYILLALAIVAVSCTKPEDDEPVKKTTVQVTNNNVFYESSIEGLNATLYDATLLLYKGSDLVGQINLGNIQYAGGKSQIIEIADYIEKAKLMFKILPSNTTYSNQFKYTAQFYIMSPKTDNKIIITDQTLVSNSPTKGFETYKIFK